MRGIGRAMGGAGQQMAIPLFDDATGCVSKSLEDRLREALDDPAVPVPLSSERWVERNLSEDEIRAMSRVMATLTHKVARVSGADQGRAAIAVLFATQCIRHLYMMVGDIVHRVSIERGGFVVVRFKTPARLPASGRMVVSPMGVCGYGLSGGRRQWMSHCKFKLGMVVPLSDQQLEIFESFGWRRKGSVGLGNDA